MKTLFTLTFLATTCLAQSDPQLSSWHTSGSGKYARIVETDAELLAGSTKTTWTRTSGPNTISQSLPVYAGPQQIDYSTNYIYLRTPSLATHTMGPWYNNAAKTALFVNVPKNQGLIIQIPRSSILGAIPTTKTRTGGYRFNNVMQDAVGWLVDGVAIFDPTDGWTYSNGSESGSPTGEWHRDAYVNEGITFDTSLAHQQNAGKYHHHANPLALRYQLGDAVAFNNTTKAYSETLTPTQHSPIVGWMLDGLPIYGPYGYSSALDSSSGVRRMIGGFVRRNGATVGVDNVTSAGRTLPAWALRNNNNTSASGPAVSTTYPLGRYIEDWAYLGDLQKSVGVNYAQGTDFDLNEYNVRWCVTPEFPSGTWAYFTCIDSTGTPQYPYLVNRWFYGTPGGGSVASITETVTNHFRGGANQALEIASGPTLSSGSVTLTWKTVEGGSYAVDASTDNSAWTNKVTGLTSSTGTRSNSHTALATTGTEYARVQRTALASYDSTGTVAATVSQTASGSFIHPASLTISTASTLPGSLVNAAYSQSFTATSGTEPYTWTLSAGSLPADCVLSTAGVLSGVPTLTGSSSFTLQVQDGAAVTVSKAFTVTIAGTAPSITTLTLPLAVKTAAYAQTLTATDGTTPYSWSLSAGALPSGMTLSSTGVLSGTPTVSGVFNFTVKVTDGANIQAKQSYSLTVAASYSVPVMAAVSLGSTTVGQSYTATVSASNYPKTFTLTGLPAGLTYSKTAGIITGRASVTGVFNVQIKASNSAGTSAVVSAALVVKALDPGLIGSYTGIISRSVSANSNLGGLLALTLTTQGTFTAKINAAGKSTSVKGYLNAAAPQVQVTVGSAVLSLTLAGADTATGTHGTAAVTAWRHAWNTTTNPASAHAGYYTLSIDLQSGTDLGVSSIPQGSSYATLSVLASGAIKISGKTADGQSITSAGFMGAAGECALHTSLYANLGSISGLLNVQSGSSGDFSLNAVTGQITWSKPVSTTRTYAAAFGPLNLAAAGLYLAPAASGSVILGLPSTGSAALTFMEGGLALATTDPDVNAFTYSDTNVVTMPTAGSIANPAKATLSLNKNTGAMKGKFTLVDSGASRSVSFSGLIVRQLSGQVLAKGYFLLPQIPVGSEKASTSPILSGGVQISQ